MTDEKLIKKQIDSERGRVVYWVSQGEQPITLVLLPGLTADHRLFENQICAFAGEYRLLVWDCPCHGESRPYNGFTYACVIRELKRILDAEHICRAVFIGQSLGGMLAQSFINRYPGMALGFISIDSAPLGDYYSRSDFFWLNQIEWLAHMFPNRLLRKSIAAACGATPQARQRMFEMLSVYTKRELCRLLYVGEAAFIPENHPISLPCPTILLLGQKDRVGKVAAYNRLWSKRTAYPLHIVQGAAHNANDDCPEQVNALIHVFLQCL